MTISSLHLLSAVLELHSPNAIIVHLDFLPQLLELLTESMETTYPTLIVVGEGDLPDAVIKSSAKIIWLVDLERKGRRGGAVQSSNPGSFPPLIPLKSRVINNIFNMKIPKRCFPYLSTLDATMN